VSRLLLIGQQVLWAVGEAGKETVPHELQTMAYANVVATIISLGFAAFLFYPQRSLLALYLRQISLAVARLVDPRPTTKAEWTPFEWIDDADSWTTWGPSKHPVISRVANRNSDLL
jgi:hypothetical protein